MAFTGIGAIAGTGYKEGSIMSDGNPMPFVGLCLTCNNAAQCYFRAHRGHDAIYCEMFDNYTAPRGNGEGKITSQASSSGESTGQPESPAVNGLCSNCANQATCALPKPQGGIWHCEEYA